MTHPESTSENDLVRLVSDNPTRARRASEMAERLAGCFGDRDLYQLARELQNAAEPVNTEL